MSSTRTNLEVADVFVGIIDLLEQQGENPFKIRAYRNAVRTLETLPEQVAAINDRGELKKIPGFGDAIVGKTQEILATGTCALYERLKAEQQQEIPEDSTHSLVNDISEAHEENVITSEEEIPSPW